MTVCSRGDVVLVEFAFSDESGTKLRPALVVSSSGYNQSRQELIIAAITSNVTRRLYGDYTIVNWQEAGLLFPSQVTGIVRTIKQSMVRRTLGGLSAADMAAVDRALRQSLALRP